jgi:hypothetical protein
VKTVLACILVCVAAVLLVLAAGAGQPPPAAGAPGFWLGLVHGATALFSLFTSLFAPVRIYAVPNDGFLYDLGFVTGFTAFLVGVFVATMARIGGMIS